MKRVCPWGCGPLVRDARRETICMLGHTIVRRTAGWWCDKCGEAVIDGPELVAAETELRQAPQEGEK